MSMAISGAPGSTASEMMRALTMNMAADVIDVANAELLATLNGYDHHRDVVSTKCPPGATVDVNALGGGESTMLPKAAANLAQSCWPTTL
jgi:hypothetical protein